ncbi:MAG TPA: MauE/DoxX family redox-associated membrane protein [Thermomonospora sp.]|nr:MauE/DoxX family redox-associated membrane protein [Thermomonospora sp.]
MIEAVTSVAATTAALILLLGCAEHLLAPRSLPAALAAHGTVPRRLAGPLAAVVTAAEGLVGLAVAGCVVTGSGRGPLTVALAAAGVLLGAYAAYTYRLLRRAEGRGVPCGCSRADTPVSGWVVLRAAVPAVLAVGAAVGADAVVTPAESAAWFAEASVAGAVFAVLLWVLPEAMIDPGAALRDGRHGV